MLSKFTDSLLVTLVDTLDHGKGREDNLEQATGFHDSFNGRPTHIRHQKEPLPQRVYGNSD